MNAFYNFDFFSVCYLLPRTDLYPAVSYLGDVFWIGLWQNLHSDCVVRVCMCEDSGCYLQFRAIPTADNAHRLTILFGGLEDQK